MLTIQGLQSKGIVLTPAELDEFESDPEHIELEPPPKNNTACNMCHTVPGRIYEYNNLDLCVPCVTQILKAERFKELRAIPVEKVVDIKSVEAGLVRDALSTYATKTSAANALGITRATLYAKMRKYDIAID